MIVMMGDADVNDEMIPASFPLLSAVINATAEAMCVKVESVTQRMHERSTEDHSVILDAAMANGKMVNA